MKKGGPLPISDQLQCRGSYQKIECQINRSRFDQKGCYYSESRSISIQPLGAPEYLLQIYKVNITISMSVSDIYSKLFNIHQIIQDGLILTHY